MWTNHSPVAWCVTSVKRNRTSRDNRIEARLISGRTSRQQFPVGGTKRVFISGHIPSVFLRHSRRSCDVNIENQKMKRKSACSLIAMRVYITWPLLPTKRSVFARFHWLTELVQNLYHTRCPGVDKSLVGRGTKSEVRFFYLHAVDSLVPWDPRHFCWNKDLEKCRHCKRKKEKIEYGLSQYLNTSENDKNTPWMTIVKLAMITDDQLFLMQQSKHDLQYTHKTSINPIYC